MLLYLLSLTDQLVYRSEHECFDYFKQHKPVPGSRNCCQEGQRSVLFVIVPFEEVINIVSVTTMLYTSSS